MALGPGGQGKIRGRGPPYELCRDTLSPGSQAGAWERGGEGVWAGPRHPAPGTLVHDFISTITYSLTPLTPALSPRPGVRGGNETVFAFFPLPPFFPLPRWGEG